MRILTFDLPAEERMRCIGRSFKKATRVSTVAPSEYRNDVSRKQDARAKLQGGVDNAISNYPEEALVGKKPR